MRKEEVFSQIKTILDTCELSDLIKVSENPFELADYHMYDDNYLGMDGKKLIHFSSIQKISYCHGDDRLYTNVGMNFILIFKLVGYHELWVEYNTDDYDRVLTICIHNETESSYINDHEKKELFSKYLNRYNNQQSALDTIVASLQFPYDFDSKTDCENLNLWINEANKYMNAHKTSDACEEILFALVDAALWVNETGSTYTFENLNLKNLVEQLIINSKVYSYLQYRYDFWYKNIDEDGFRECENTILRLKQEIEASKE